MLKYAYQLGIAQAYLDSGADPAMVKEAVWGAAAAKAFGSGLKTMGSGAWNALRGLRAGGQVGYEKALAAGAGRLGAAGQGIQRGANLAGKQLGTAWKSLTPLQQKTLAGSGAAGLYMA